MRLFIANLLHSTTEDQVWAAFEQFGEVTDVRFARDRETGAFRCFCFVTMAHEPDALQAIEQLHGSTWGGRVLHVEPARAKTAA
jgi:RNA recognition motif-containing protein